MPSLQASSEGTLRVSKNYVKGYSEAKVREATSNDPWGPSGTQMDEIAQMTYSQNDFVEIIEMLGKRLNDKGKNWRHVFKALVLLDYCLQAGSEEVAIHFRDNIHVITILREFQFIDEFSKDQGGHVRYKAKEITKSLRDESRLREQRESHAYLRDWMINGLSGYLDGGDEYSRRNRASPSSSSRPKDANDLRKVIVVSTRSLASEQEKQGRMTATEESDLPVALKLSDEEEGSRNSRFPQSSSDDSPADMPRELINVEWVSKPVSMGGYAFVFRGMWNGQPVALKQLHTQTTNSHAKLRKRLLRESLIWQQQTHPNILPFLGIFAEPDQHDTFVYMVSPWQENGNLKEFLEKNRDANIVDILVGVACALEYLHGQNPTIVHGDLRTVNILVSEDYTPRLSDFGLASIVHNPANGEPGLLSADTSTANRGGAARWQAPELLGLDEVEEPKERPRFTPETDIYSFAMVIMEVFTGTVPFAQISKDHKVIDLVSNGQRPSRPTHRQFSDMLWKCTNQCWAHNPKERLSAHQLVPLLRKLQ